MLSRRIKEAPVVWSQLNGIINIFKPAGVSEKQVRSTIVSKLCQDLNEMEVRQPEPIIKIEPDDNGNFVVKQERNYADDILVVGPRYQNKDVRCGCSNFLGKFTSGVFVLGINGGLRNSTKLRDNRPVRAYHITGRFGKSTETHFSDSPVTARATYDHIGNDKINGLVSSMQASHQKKMYEMCGVDLQSQAAYDLAVQGPIRPMVTNIPLIYGIRCIEFRRPYFKIEIHAVNETEAYMGILIHEIALQLKSVAHCTQIKCIRNSHFTLEHSLVQRQWNIQSILNNMAQCNEIIRRNPEMLKQHNVKLVE